MIYCFDPLADDKHKSYKYDSDFFRNEGSEVTYVFTDMIDTNTMVSIMKGLKVKDEKVIWLYSYFAEKTLKYPSFTLTDYVNSLSDKPVNYVKYQDHASFTFMNDSHVDAYFYDAKEEIILRTELVSHGRLIKVDYYLDELLYSELYTYRGSGPQLYSRRFYNVSDNSSYDEIDPQHGVKFVFGNSIVESRSELFELFLKMLQLSESDVVMIDSSHRYLNLISPNVGKASLRITQASSVFDVFDF